MSVSRSKESPKGGPKEGAREGSVDIDSLVEERISVNRDEIRQQVLRDMLADCIEDAVAKNITLEAFLNELKNRGKEVWRFASRASINDLAGELAGAGYLAAENRRLKEELRLRRSGAAPAGRRRAQREDIEALKAEIVAHLRQHPDQTIGQLVKGLKSDAATLKRPLSELRRDGKIKAEGERRSMRYSLP
jgi:DNA-binding transcriptional ArsR family regulator